MSEQEPTDIWFRTSLELSAVSQLLGAELLVEDAEDTWEWVEAEIDGFQIDINRKHTVEPPESTETGILMVRDAGPKIPIPSALRQMLVSGLQRAGVEPIYVGRCIVDNDNNFVAHEYEAIA